MGLMQIVMGVMEGDEAQEAAIARQVRRWAGRDDDVVTSLRTRFGIDGGHGTDMYDHVIEHFIKPMVSELADAEAELETMNWSKVFSCCPTMLAAWGGEATTHRPRRRRKNG